jgi:exodeoxyribonuclease VII large subunit
VQAASSRLAAASPAARLARLALREASLTQRLREALQRRLQGAASQLDVARRTLHAVSPLATLERGFAIVTRAADGALVRSVEQLAAGDEIHARLGTGRLRARVLAREPPTGDGT